MDRELEFMRDLGNDELGVFVDVMRTKGDLTESLSSSDEYAEYGDDYEAYVPRIVEEYQLFGSNSIWTTFFDPNSYREILLDVANQMKLGVHKGWSTTAIEERLLEVVLERSWQAMGWEERRKFLAMLRDAAGKDAADAFAVSRGAVSSAALIALFRAGGFASYQMTAIIMNLVARAILGRGISLAGNALIMRSLGILAGPVGMAITGMWTLVSLAGPAYRVTIPCTILIAGFRRMHRYDSDWDSDE